MKADLFRNISFLKLTGKKYFLMIDIHPDVVIINLLKRNESFHNLKKASNLDDYVVINTAVEFIDSDYSKIPEAIKIILQKHEIKEISAVIGINEFKLEFISLPSDTEDADIWFTENCEKFLPAGRPHDEFGYSYDIYREDEVHKYFFIVIARKDYLSKIIELCSLKGISIIAVLPFIVSTIKEAVVCGNDLLAVNVLPGKITYLYAAPSKTILYNEVYSNNYSNTAGNNFISSNFDFEINVDELEKGIGEIQRNLQLSLNASPGNFRIIKENWKGDYLPDSQLLDKYFYAEETFPKINKDNSNSILSMLAFKRIVYDYDSGINLLGPDIIERERENLEKTISLRAVLSGGIILILLLLIINAAGYYFSNEIQNNEEKVSSILLEEEQIKKLEERNKALKENLVQLVELKQNRPDYSNLFYILSGSIEDNSFLSSVDLKTVTKSNAIIGINGFSGSQQEIAKIISNLEDEDDCSNVSLLNASEQDKNRTIDTLISKDYLQFKISFNYNADKK